VQTIAVTQSYARSGWAVFADSNMVKVEDAFERHGVELQLAQVTRRKKSMVHSQDPLKQALAKHSEVRFSRIAVAVECARIACSCMCACSGP
jgi:hypothetical protein